VFFAAMAAVWPGGDGVHADWRGEVACGVHGDGGDGRVDEVGPSRAAVGGLVKGQEVNVAVGVELRDHADTGAGYSPVCGVVVPMIIIDPLVDGDIRAVRASREPSADAWECGASSR
jgi:hypothetical protein